MHEHRKSQLATAAQFKQRLLKTGLFSILLFGFSLTVGIFGYHYIAGLRWVDSFLNASMILGGMGPVDALKMMHQKYSPGFIRSSAVLLFYQVWRYF